MTRSTNRIRLIPVNLILILKIPTAMKLLFYVSHSFYFYFCLEQLDQIKRISLARIICDNNEGSVQSIQPLAMKAARDS